MFHRFVFVDDPTVTVIGVLAKTNIGNDHQFGKLLLQLTDRLLNDPVIGRRLAACRIFFSRDAEQDHRRNSKLHDFGASAVN